MERPNTLYRSESSNPGSAGKFIYRALSAAALLSTVLFAGCKAPSCATRSKNMSFLEDVDTYRYYSVSEGSRSPVKNFELAGYNTTNMAHSVVGIVTLGYGTPRFEEERFDDLRPLRAGKELGHASADFWNRLTIYNDKKVYHGLNWVTAPLTYPLRVVGGAGNVVDNTVNTVTFGLGNNITHPPIALAQDTVETTKHLAQGVLNTTIRSPVYALPKKWREPAHKFMDWPINVGTELPSNVIQGNGIHNAEFPSSWIGQKGNFGYTLESIATLGLLGYELNTVVANPSSVTESEGTVIGGPGGTP